MFHLITKQSAGVVKPVLALVNQFFVALNDSEFEGVRGAIALLRELLVCEKVVPRPVVILPAVIVAKEKGAVLTICRNTLVEEVIEDCEHQSGVALEEHADAAFEKTVSREDHLVDSCG